MKKDKNQPQFPFQVNGYTHVPNQFCPTQFPYGIGIPTPIPPAMYTKPHRIYIEETSLYELEGILTRNYGNSSMTPTLVFSKFINHIIDTCEKSIDPINDMKLVNPTKERADAHGKIVVKTIDFVDSLVSYFGGDPKKDTTENEDPDINIEGLMESLLNPAKVKEYICLSTMVICLGTLRLRTFANILRNDSPVYGDSPFLMPTNVSLKTFLEELRNSYEECDDITEDSSTDKFLRNQYRLDIAKALTSYAMKRKMSIHDVHINIWYDTYFPVLGMKENGEMDLFHNRYIETNRFSEYD